MADAIDTDIRTAFEEAFQEGAALAPGYSQRALKTPLVGGGVNFRELDMLTITNMFADLKNNPDGRASLALMVGYIYNMTPPR